MLKTVVYSIKHSVLKNSTIKQKIRIREKKVFDFFCKWFKLEFYGLNVEKEKLRDLFRKKQFNPINSISSHLLKQIFA